MNIKKAADEATSLDYQYWPVRGKEIAVDSLVRNMSKIYYKPITKDEITLSSGGVQFAMSLLATFIKQPEDEIITIEPYYPFYFSQNPHTIRVKRVCSIPQSYFKNQFWDSGEKR